MPWFNNVAHHGTGEPTTAYPSDDQSLSTAQYPPIVQEPSVGASFGLLSQVNQPDRSGHTTNRRACNLPSSHQTAEPRTRTQSTSFEQQRPGNLSSVTDHPEIEASSELPQDSQHTSDQDDLAPQVLTPSQTQLGRQAHRFARDGTHQGKLSRSKQLSFRYSQLTREEQQVRHVRAHELFVLMMESFDLMMERFGLMKERFGMMKENSGLMKENSDMMKENSGLMMEHSGRMMEHSGLMMERSRLIMDRMIEVFDQFD
jgi:hypothetical protein